MRAPARGRGPRHELSSSPAAEGVGYRAVLGVADFRRLAVALAVDAMGSWASSVVLLVYIYNRTHSAGWVAAASVLRFLPGLLLSTYGGVVAERYERTLVLRTSAWSCFAAAVGLTIVVATDAPVALAVALSVVISIVSTPYAPAVGALVPQVVGAEHLVAANSVKSTIDNLATIAGPAVGALIAGSGHPSVAFAVDAASFAFAALLIGRLGARSVPSDLTEHGPNPFKQMAVGVLALRELPRVRLLVLLSALATGVYGADTVLFAPISRHLHAGSGGYGYLITGLAVGGILAATFINRLADRTDLAVWIGLGMAVYCLPTALIPWVHNGAAGTAIQVVRGAGTLVVDVLAIAAVQRAVPANLLSRVLGFFDSLVFAAAALGALVTPWLLSGFGFRTTLLVVAVVPPALTVLSLPGLWRADRDARARVERLRPTTELLSGLSFFQGADATAIERIAEAAERREVPAGATVVREGDATDGFFVVVAGEVAVTTTGESGESAGVVRTLGPGDHFGEIGLLYGVRRTATVSAVTPTELLYVPGPVFLETFTPGSAPAMFATATGRLARTHPVLATRVASAEAAS